MRNKNLILLIIYINYSKVYFELNARMEVFMDYEIMMNGNVRIGQRAPEFEAVTTMGNISLNDYRGKWVVLFSHPGDFTPVKSYNLGKYKKA